MNSLRIAIFGPAFAAAPASPAAGAWRCLRQLARHGHRVTLYQPDLFGRRFRHVHADSSDGVRTVSYPADGYLGLFECLEEAARAHVIVKFSGAGPFDELLGGAVLEIRKPEAIAVWLDCDGPATLNRLRRDTTDPIFALMSEFDLVLSAGGGMPLVESLKHLGVAECLPLDGAEASQSMLASDSAAGAARSRGARLWAVAQAFDRAFARRAAPPLGAAIH